MPQKCESRTPSFDGSIQLTMLPSFAVGLSDDFNLNDADQEEKIKELHSNIEHIMLRRLKKDVIQSLPSKSERILRVEMSGMQTHFYKSTSLYPSAPEVRKLTRSIRNCRHLDQGAFSTNASQTFFSC